MNEKLTQEEIDEAIRFNYKCYKIKNWILAKKIERCKNE